MTHMSNGDTRNQIFLLIEQILEQTGVKNELGTGLELDWLHE